MYENIIAIGVSLLVAVVNFLLKFILKKMGAFERFASIGLQTTATLTKLFVAVFVNMGVLMLFINANLQDFTVVQSITNSLPFGKELFFNGEFSDTTRQWYQDVGVPIITLMIITLASNIVSAMINRLIRSIKRCLLKKKKVLQVDLNTLYEGGEFDLADKYVKVLAFIFVCFMYSGGVPLLLPVLVVYLTLQYWVDKWLFMRYYKIPPKFNLSIHNRSMQIVPYALILHVLMSLWFYTTPELYPVIVVGSDSKDSQVRVYDRLFSDNGFVFLLLLVGIVVYFLFQETILTLVCKRCCNRKIAIDVPDEGFANSKQKIDLTGIASYDIYENPKYV